MQTPPTWPVKPLDLFVPSLRLPGKMTVLDCTARVWRVLSEGRTALLSGAVHSTLSATLSPFSSSHSFFGMELSLCPSGKLALSNSLLVLWCVFIGRISFLRSNIIDLQSTTFGAIQAGGIFSFAPDISSAKGAGSDIIKLLDSMPEVDAESTEGKILDEKMIRGHIRFEGVHFRYPTRPGVRILRDLSFKVEPGTYIALVGASGSGKSTA